MNRQVGELNLNLKMVQRIFDHGFSDRVPLAGLGDGQIAG